MTAPPRIRRRVSYVPPQHGAWAFLGLPIAAAVTIAPSSLLLVVLAVGWVAAYPVSYFLLAIVRERASRRQDPDRFRRPLRPWLALLVVAGVVLLAFRPWLAWVALAYAASFVVNIGFARRRDERALTNDAVFIAQCTVMTVVAWAVAAGERSPAPPPLSSAPHTLWVLTAAVAMLLAGSTLHVKSLIRERADPRYRRASDVFALACLAASFGLAAWWGLPEGLLLVAPFAWFAGRALVLRGPPPRPARIGMIELVGFVLLVGAAAAAQAGGAA